MNDDRRRTVQVVSSNGLEYANFVAEQLGGQVYEVQTTIKLSRFRGETQMKNYHVKRKKHTIT